MADRSTRGLALASLVAVLSGCAALGALGLGPPKPFEPPPLALHSDVADLGWLIGRWKSDDGRGEETWVPAGDSLLGVSFIVEERRTVAWEALITGRDRNGKVLYRAMPMGGPAVSFELAKNALQGARFSNPSHDYPKHIAYVRRDDGPISRLGVRLVGDGPEAELALLLVPLAPAAELEEADRRFAEDVADRGLDAWVEAFDEAGAMARGDQRVEGREAIRELMRESLTNPAERLRWAPVSSGRSPAGDLGYTIGAWVSEKRAGMGGWGEAAHGAYVTIWKRAADGRWRVLFDAGDASET